MRKGSKGAPQDWKHSSSLKNFVGAEFVILWDDLNYVNSDVSNDLNRLVNLCCLFCTSCLFYLHTLLSWCPCTYGRGRVPDRLHCAAWPQGRCRRRSHRCLGHHIKRSQHGNVHTPLARCPQKTPRDSLQHTGPHGESDIPRNLHKQQLFSFK